MTPLKIEQTRQLFAGSGDCGALGGGEREHRAAEPALTVVARRSEASRRKRRWGVVLAGGDGERLRPLTQLICGDERPKQFCPLFGNKTLLEQTLDRSTWNIEREQVLVSLTWQHHRWYTREKAVKSWQRVVQPSNRGTAPPIVHSLLSVMKMDPYAVVAILPCDHHYEDEGAFSAALERAFETAEKRPDCVVLLGARPDYPEVEYGWIELGTQLRYEESELFQVRGFREKPPVEIARMLLAGGAVWNTFVMVGHVRAFLALVQASTPDLLIEMGTAKLWDGSETHIERPVYERMPSIGFSHEVLAVMPSRLLTLRLNGAGWSDLGDPGRALMAVLDSGQTPEWAENWSRAGSVSAHTPGPEMVRGFRDALPRREMRAIPAWDRGLGLVRK